MLQSVARAKPSWQELHRVQGRNRPGGTCLLRCALPEKLCFSSGYVKCASSECLVVRLLVALVACAGTILDKSHGLQPREKIKISCCQLSVLEALMLRFKGVAIYIVSSESCPANDRFTKLEDGNCCFSAQTISLYHRRVGLHLLQHDATSITILQIKISISAAPTHPKVPCCSAAR